MEKIRVETIGAEFVNGSLVAPRLQYRGAMLLLLLLPAVFAQSYISEPPVKLLTADLFGDLFPAAASQYRVSSTGHDQNISLTDLEEANRRG